MYGVAGRLFFVSGVQSARAISTYASNAMSMKTNSCVMHARRPPRQRLGSTTQSGRPTCGPTSRMITSQGGWWKTASRRFLKNKKPEEEAAVQQPYVDECIERAAVLEYRVKCRPSVRCAAVCRAVLRCAVLCCAVCAVCAVCVSE